MNRARRERERERERGREREREREGERGSERGRDRGGLYYLAVNQTAVDWPIEGGGVRSFLLFICGYLFGTS